MRKFILLSLFLTAVFATPVLAGGRWHDRGYRNGGGQGCYQKPYQRQGYYYNRGYGYRSYGYPAYGYYAPVHPAYPPPPPPGYYYSSPSCPPAYGTYYGPRYGRRIPRARIGVDIIF